MRAAAADGLRVAVRAVEEFLAARRRPPLPPPGQQLPFNVVHETIRERSFAASTHACTRRSSSSRSPPLELLSWATT